MSCDHQKIDHHHHQLTEEQLTVRRLQLARSWAVRKISSSKKCLLGSIYSWTWLEKDLYSLLEGLLPWRRRGSSERVDVSGCGLRVSFPFGESEDTQECSLTACFVRHNWSALHAQNVTKELELT